MKTWVESLQPALSKWWRMAGYEGPFRPEAIVRATLGVFKMCALVHELASSKRRVD
jgi:hypothetical protein